MFYHIISSGSKGNATIVRNFDTVILIDMGITLKRLEEGLKEINLTLKDIDALIFTHDHSDHYSGLKFFSPKIQYALKGTLPTDLSNVVNLWEEFNINTLSIIPLPTSHDAKNPCGYLIKDKDESLLYMTDTGYVIDKSIEFAKNPTYLIIESNHDIKMLLNTNRTLALKERILSKVGHLCNEDSAIAAASIIGDKTKEIVLAHLSEEANTPEQALKAYHDIFSFKGIDINKYVIKTANQHSSVSGGSVYED